jgi:hypothetical protein
MQLSIGEQKSSLLTLEHAIEFFSIHNPEEGLQVQEELLHVVQDFKLINSATEPAPKKKAKTAEPSNKWIKVLIELMIQLLTKSTCTSSY